MLHRLAKEISLRGQALSRAYMIRDTCSQCWESAHGASLLSLRPFTASSTGQSEQAQQTLSNKPTGPKPAQGAQAALNQTPVPGFKGVPAMPKFLGLAGAIPFLALAPPIAAGIPFMPADLVANAALLQIGYGASIASFLGGIHWAMAMAYGSAGAQTNNDRYLWSVTPCLMAWPAIIMQAGPASLVVGSVLGVCYVVDRSFTKRGLLPPWYMALRLPLTVAAVAGMSITLVSSLTNHVPERGPAVVPKELNADSS